MTKKMGLYCKAYYLRDLRAFDRWTEKELPLEEGNASRDSDAHSLDDDDVVFVHDDHSVTSGVFAGMTVINEGKVDGWAAFCRDALGFAVPADVIDAGTLAAQDLAEMER